MESVIKELELREWLKDKKSNQMFVLMCYASISFSLQRKGIRDLCLKISKADNDLYHKLKITENIVCGWGDEITTLVSRCYPDFLEKFGKGISIKRCEEIICDELDIAI